MTARLTTSTQSGAGGVINIASGNVVAGAAAATDEPFLCGFTPRYVKFINRTDGVQLEWFDGMAANSAIRTVAAGTRTLDAASGITVSQGQFLVKAADLPASKSCSWLAFG
jgi:hypothetical protein